MSTMQVRLQDLSTAVATVMKQHKVLINNNATDLSALSFGTKANLVTSLNELKTQLDAAVAAAGATINDASSASTTQTWSINKISAQITAAITAITNGAPAALDTLKELSDAIGADANFAGTITTALGNRVRTDTAAQGLTTLQKSNARANIDAYGSVEIGNPDTDFVAIFQAGLI